jgi:hypothetical protein
VHDFIQCDQAECQYVDENVPPCPLTPAIIDEDTQPKGSSEPVDE